MEFIEYLFRSICFLLVREKLTVIKSGKSVFMGSLQRGASQKCVERIQIYVVFVKLKQREKLENRTSGKYIERNELINTRIDCRLRHSEIHK